MSEILDQMHRLYYQYIQETGKEPTHIMMPESVWRDVFKYLSGEEPFGAYSTAHWRGLPVKFIHTNTIMVGHCVLMDIGISTSYEIPGIEASTW
tara:strand:+ start:161 stop:442 length:282 start_codon:yes stop_codon:yes gene_type:complete